MTLKIESEVFVDVHQANQEDDGDNGLELGRWYVFVNGAVLEVAFHNGVAVMGGHDTEAEAIQWVTDNRQHIVDVHGVASLPVEGS